MTKLTWYILVLGLWVYAALAIAQEQTDPAFTTEQAVQKARQFLQDDQNNDLQKNNCVIKKVEYIKDPNSYHQSHWSIIWSAPGQQSEWACAAEMRLFNNGSIIRVLGYY